MCHVQEWLISVELSPLNELDREKLVHPIILKLYRIELQHISILVEQMLVELYCFRLVRLSVCLSVVTLT